MNDYYVYQLRLSTETLPFYIGKGKGSRRLVHLRPSSLTGRSRKNSIIKKAKADCVEVLVEVIKSGLTDAESIALEISEIARLGRIEDGGILANHTKGGEGRSGFSPSKETRAKIAIGRTGKKHSPETRAKMSETRKGRTRNPEFRDQIGDWARGRPKSPETVKKMSDAKRGKPASADHVKAVKFAIWDKDPYWSKAGTIFSFWKTNGKPGRTKLAKAFPGIDRTTIQTRFAKGWIPENDPVWVEYATTRFQPRRLDD